MAHASALDACNEALITLGQDVTLVTLDKSSSDPKERDCAYLYETARKQVLSDHPWSFIREELEYDPPRRSVDLPADAVRIVACLDEDGYNLAFRCVGGKVKSDDEIARLVFTRDEEDLTEWDPDAYKALVLRLAADLAKPITGRINERQLQEQAYAEQIEKAKLKDARNSGYSGKAYGRNYYVDRMQGRGAAGV